MYNKKRVWQLIFIAAVFVVGIIVFSIFNILENEKYSATLEIVVAPEKATLTLNGKKYENGAYRMMPGLYEVSLSAEGFEPFNETLELTKNETTYLYHYLTGPGGDISHYAQNQADSLLFMTITNYEAGLAAKAYAERDKVFTITPYYDINKDHFIINAEINWDDKIVITVDLNTCTDLLKDKYIAEANAYLKNHGLDLDNYVINYIGLCD